MRTARIIISTLALLLGLSPAAPAAGADELGDCAGFINGKPVLATLDVAGGPGLSEVTTPRNPPTGPDGTGGDWWAYAPQVFTNFCESAAYIRVIPSISSSTLVFSYWSTTDWASTGWPAPDGCGHSTLRWALYGKRWFTGSWQLLTDPGTGLAANTAIYGTPPAQSKGFCEHSYWNTPTAPIDYGPRFIWMPVGWWALYSDFRIVAYNWMHNEHFGDWRTTDCQRQSCFYPVHLYGLR